MSFRCKKTIAFLVILGIVFGYGFLINNNLFSVKGATPTPTPAGIGNPTPTLAPGVTPVMYTLDLKITSFTIGGTHPFRGRVEMSPPGISVTSNTTQTYRAGTYVTLKAVNSTSPDPQGFWTVFASWSGDTSSTQNQISLLMNGNKSVTASFRIFSPTVTPPRRVTPRITVTPTRRITPTPTSRFTPTLAPSSTATVTTTQAPTATPTPIQRITPTIPRPSPILNPTIPPGVIVTVNIEKVNDTAEGGPAGQFRLWTTQTGSPAVNGYLWVNYTISGTATHQVDYQGQFSRPLPGGIYVTLGSPPPPPTGTLLNNIYIYPLGDDLIEGTETVILTLTGVTVGVGMNSATLNITDGPVVTSRPTPTPIPTPQPTPTATPTPAPIGNYAVIYTIQSDWGNGATIQVTIKNNHSFAVNGWILAWTFFGNQTITNMWNGAYTQNGASISAKNGGSNATIPGNGGSVSFGFNLNYTGINAEPAAFTLNGTDCVVQ